MGDGSIDVGEGRSSPSLSASRQLFRSARERGGDDRQVVADGAPLAITRQRGEGAVLISASEWASIEETLYLLLSRAATRRLVEGIVRMDAGKGEDRP